MASVDISKIGTGSTKVDPATMLRAQLNRFANPNAPATFRFFKTDLPSTGPIDGAVSARAGVVMMTRVALGSVDDPFIAKLAGDVAADLTGRVARDNVGLVTGIVTGFADTHGLPKARLPGIIGFFASLSTSTILSGLVGLGAGVYFSRRKKQA